MSWRRSPVSKLFRGLAMAASLWVAGHAAPALAAETDWLYFPMYERDTAHAVDLKALRFRANDGLLVSGSRYPLVNHDSDWTAEQMERAWRSYNARLIDCETGYFLETRVMLLDESGREFASRVMAHADWVERLAGQLRRGEQAWPRSGGEILLACAAASSPTIKAQRRRQASTPAPLISYRPLTQDLAADSDALLNDVRRMPYDLDDIAKRPPATATALAERLRRQYTDWRRRINRAHSPAVPAGRLPSQANVDAQLVALGGRPGQARPVAPGVIEHESRWTPGWGASLPSQASDAHHASETTRTDCESGLSVSLSRQFFDGEGRLLVRTPIPFNEARDAVAMRLSAYGESNTFAASLLSHEAVSLCRAFSIAAQKQAAPGSLAEPEPQAADGELAFGLGLRDLQAQPTPEAMLLKIRAAVRAARQAGRY
jgi:hypothetical protein